MLKVYGFQGWRWECPPEPNGSRATREICAAPSKAAVARATGHKSPRSIFNLTETGNASERHIALSQPGAVFWRPLDRYREPFVRAAVEKAPP